MQNQDAETIRIFATVGSTRFDHLVSTLLSPDFLTSIANAVSQSQTSIVNSNPKPSSKPRMVELTIQYGSTPIADILTSKDSPFLSSRDENSLLNPDFGLYYQEGKGLVNRSRNPEIFDGGLTGSLNLGIEFGKETGLRKRVRKEIRQKEKVEEEEIRETDKIKSADQENEDWVDESENETQTSQEKGIKKDQFSMFQSGILEATSPQGVKLKLFPYTLNLKEYFASSDVIISHAGSGTILEVLRLPKFQKVEPNSAFPRLLVVPNTSLMDNHQVELAEALSSKNYLIQALPWDLVKTIQSLLKSQKEMDSSSSSTPIPFPPFDPSKFRQLVDEEMGF